MIHVRDKKSVLNLMFKKDSTFNDTNKNLWKESDKPEEYLTTNSVMDVKEEDGSAIAVMRIPFKNILFSEPNKEPNDYWAFWRYKTRLGQENSNRIYHDYKELNIVKPSTVLSFYKGDFLNNVKLVHQCNGEKFKLYEWKNNSIVVKDSVPAEILSATIKNSASSNKKMLVKSNENNPYRYGIIYEKQVDKGSDGTGTLNDNISLECKFTTLYSLNEYNTEKEYVDVVFDFGSIEHEIEVNANSNLSNTYRLVLVARNNKGSIVAHSLYNEEGCTLSMTWKDFKEITNSEDNSQAGFELMIVDKYDGEGLSNNNNNGGGAPSLDKVNVKVTLTAPVRDNKCTCVKDKAEGEIISDKPMQIIINYGTSQYGMYLILGEGEFETTLFYEITQYDNTKLSGTVGQGGDYYVLTDGKIIINDPIDITPDTGNEETGDSTDIENGEENENIE